MSNTLTHNNYNTEQIRNPILLAEHFSKSEYFKDTSDISKAVVKIVAGQELGFGPMASISGFHIVQGKPTISANLMGAAIKRSGRYNYKVVAMSETICSIDFYEDKEFCGNSDFTIEQARKAGTQNLTKYPRNMLFARALSNGARWYCPDVLNGSPIYTPEELGAEVDEDGEVVAIPKPAETPKALAKPAETPKPPATASQIINYTLQRLDKGLEIDFEKFKKWLVDNQNLIPENDYEKIVNLIVAKESEVKIVNIEPKPTENVEEELETFTKPVEELKTI